MMTQSEDDAELTIKKQLCWIFHTNDQTKIFNASMKMNDMHEEILIQIFTSKETI